MSMSGRPAAGLESGQEPGITADTGCQVAPLPTTERDAGRAATGMLPAPERPRCAGDSPRAGIAGGTQINHSCVLFGTHSAGIAPLAAFRNRELTAFSG